MLMFNKTQLVQIEQITRWRDDVVNSISRMNRQPYTASATVGLQQMSIHPPPPSPSTNLATSLNNFPLMNLNHTAAVVAADRKRKLEALVGIDDETTFYGPRDAKSLKLVFMNMK